jgi:hypothetical protein
MGVKIIIIIIIFFYSILGYCHIGHHPQGDLAMFDFRPVMKILKIKIKIKILFISLVTCLNKCVGNIKFLD